jgi:hypothetical protein
METWDVDWDVFMELSDWKANDAILDVLVLVDSYDVIMDSSSCVVHLVVSAVVGAVPKLITPELYVLSLDKGSMVGKWAASCLRCSL